MAAVARANFLVKVNANAKQRMMLHEQNEEIGKGSSSFALRREFPATLHNFRFARCRIRLQAGHVNPPCPLANLLQACYNVGNAHVASID